MSWHDQRPRDPQQQHGFDLIGAAIRRRRAWLGWTQRQLEAYSGIDQTNISRLENGKQYGFRWSRLADLVDALGGLDAGPRPTWVDRGIAASLDRVDLDISADQPIEPSHPRRRPDASADAPDESGQLDERDWTADAYDESDRRDWTADANEALGHPRSSAEVDEQPAEPDPRDWTADIHDQAGYPMAGPNRDTDSRAVRRVGSTGGFGR